MTSRRNTIPPAAADGVVDGVSASDTGVERAADPLHEHDNDTPVPHSMSARPVDPSRADDDVQYEAGLRPRTLDGYIGQDRVRVNLQVSIAAAKGRG